MKSLLKTLFVTISIICVSNHTLRAQGPPLPPVEDPGGGPPPEVPIDGGLSIILIAAGAGYGVKKVRDWNKQKNKNNDTTVE